MGEGCERWQVKFQFSRSVVSESLQPYGRQPTRLLCPWRISKQEYQSGLPGPPPPGHLPNPGIEPRFPTLQADSFLSEPPGKPKNTAVDSLSLFQGIFLTQESNQGLLHCKQILYQLSYQGSQAFGILVKNPSKKFKLMISFKRRKRKWKPS